MNDRFKFRVWDKKRKTFLTKDLETEDFVINRRGQLILTSDYYENEEEVDEENFVIQQSTGLKDKNGELIYEGDICAFDDRKNPKYDKYFCKDEGGRIIHYVEWDENGFEFNHCQLCETEYMEVIGNIYENPELLTTNEV